MNEASGENDSPTLSAARELSALRAQTAQARAELKRLQRDIADAEDRLGRTEAAQLLEANEHLVVGILRAKTDAETAAQALSAVSRSAAFDALTQLPNRVLLLDRFVQAIANAKRRGLRVALLFVDLDNFKEVNDTLGHAVGDRVLKRVARCLESSVRGADTVSRHGGDEFVVLLTELAEAADAGRIAEKVLAALAAPDVVFDQVIRVHASIGISIYPDDGEDADMLIGPADAAMYRARRRGRGSFAFSERARGSAAGSK